MLLRTCMGPNSVSSDRRCIIIGLKNVVFISSCGILGEVAFLYHPYHNLVSPRDT